MLNKLCNVFDLRAIFSSDASWLLFRCIYQPTRILLWRGWFVCEAPWYCTNNLHRSYNDLGNFSGGFGVALTFDQRWFPTSELLRQKPGHWFTWTFCRSSSSFGGLGWSQDHFTSCSWRGVQQIVEWCGQSPVHVIKALVHFEFGDPHGESDTSARVQGILRGSCGYIRVSNSHVFADFDGTSGPKQSWCHSGILAPWYSAHLQKNTPYHAIWRNSITLHLSTKRRGNPDQPLCTGLLLAFFFMHRFHNIQLSIADVSHVSQLITTGHKACQKWSQGQFHAHDLPYSDADLWALHLLPLFCRWPLAGKQSMQDDKTCFGWDGLETIGLSWGLAYGILPRIRGWWIHLFSAAGTILWTYCMYLYIYRCIAGTCWDALPRSLQSIPWLAHKDTCKCNDSFKGSYFDYTCYTHWWIRAKNQKMVEYV